MSILSEKLLCGIMEGGGTGLNGGNRFGKLSVRTTIDDVHFSIQEKFTFSGIREGRSGNQDHVKRYQLIDTYGH